MTWNRRWKKRATAAASLLLLVGGVLAGLPCRVDAHPHGEPLLYRSWVTEIQRALLEFNWAPDGRDLLKTMRFQEIVVSNGVDYGVHREAASRLGIRF